jgi:hypothetical protein
MNDIQPTRDVKPAGKRVVSTRLELRRISIPSQAWEMNWLKADKVIEHGTVAVVW